MGFFMGFKELFFFEGLIYLIIHFLRLQDYNGRHLNSKENDFQSIIKSDL